MGNTKDHHKEGKPKEVGEFVPYKILKIATVSPNTKIFRFEVPNDKILELPTPVGHVGIRATVPPIPGYPSSSAKLLKRPYTVITRSLGSDGSLGYLEVMIKRYDESNGLSVYLHSLEEGAVVEMAVGIKKHKHAKMDFDNIHKRHKHIGIVTAGTALAPMINVIRSTLDKNKAGDGASDTRFTLLFANRSEEDILLREELERLAHENPDHLKLHFLLSRPSSSAWDQHVTSTTTEKESGTATLVKPTTVHKLTGHINKEMLASLMPAPTTTNSGSDRDDPLVLVCGPKPFKKLALKILEELGYAPHMYYKF